MARWWVSVLVSAASVLVGAAPVGGASSAAVSTGPGGSRTGGVVTPAFPGDFPDPYVLVDGQGYWAYSTGSGGRDLQVMSSRDLHRWTAPQEALAGLPAWASRGLTWAPAVVQLGGRYLMYYTVRETSSGRQCISVAAASRPSGPFVDTSTGPLVCQADRFGSIDPTPVVDGQHRYLVWKSDDNAGGATTHLWGRELAPDGLTWAGPAHHLLEALAPWHGGIIEGPSMVVAGGAHILFYGAGPWSSARAGVGYATCAGPLGPCTDRSMSGPWLGNRPGAAGPSSPAVFTDLAGELRLAYHAWTGPIGYENGGVRALFLGRLTFAAGSPVLG